MFKKTLNKVRENKKGFTLAELLIVVAIIAVLVAISIPIFNSQLEKSREAVDQANLRSAYAECAAAVLTGKTGTENGVTVSEASGNYTATKTVELKQKQNGWQSGTPEIAGVTVTDFNAGATVTVTVKDNGDAPTFTVGSTTGTPNPEG